MTMIRGRCRLVVYLLGSDEVSGGGRDACGTCSKKCESREAGFAGTGVVDAEITGIIDGCSFEPELVEEGERAGEG